MAKDKSILIERKVNIIIFVARWFDVIIDNDSRNPIINIILVV